MEPRRKWEVKRNNMGCEGKGKEKKMYQERERESRNRGTSMNIKF